MGKKSKKLAKWYKTPGVQGMEKIVYLAFPIITWAFVTWFLKQTIMGIPIFNLLMTLGGYQTYDQGVIGGVVIILLVGCLLIIWDD